MNIHRSHEYSNNAKVTIQLHDNHKQREEITSGINFQNDQNVPVYNLEPESIFLQKEGEGTYP